MKYLKSILKFLSGKKNVIQGLIATTSAFLALQGVITPDVAVYINAISLLLFGSASIATGELLYKNK